jgi:hypothetical protein
MGNWPFIICLPLRERTELHARFCQLRDEACARAVVKAMREPSEAVICAIDKDIIAVLDAPVATDKTPGEVAWQAGIDAILAEMGEKPSNPTRPWTR